MKIVGPKGGFWVTTENGEYYLYPKGFKNAAEKRIKKN